jgi:hypothetical protein
MMDNVFQTCIRTVTDQLFLLDSPDDIRSRVSPEFVMSLLEKSGQKLTEFCNSMIQLINVYFNNGSAVTPKMQSIQVQFWHNLFHNY